MKIPEEKPSRHKIIGAVASGQIKKQETSRRLRNRQKLEVQLRNNDESVNITKKEEVSRQRLLARKLVKIPINFSLVPPDQSFCKETCHLFQKMIDSARENVPGAVLGLLRSRLTEKFGPSYRTFVYRLWENIWLKVHLRCLREDAGLGLSDEGMAKMHPLHLLKLLDGVNNTNTPSVERKMKVLVREFGLDTPCSYPVQDIITELVEKVVKAFAMVAPDDAKTVFAKVAHEDAMDHAMALAVRGISLAS